MCRDPPEKRAKLNEVSDADDDDDEELPVPLLESEPYTLSQLEVAWWAELDAGSMVDDIVNGIADDTVDATDFAVGQQAEVSFQQLPDDDDIGLLPFDIDGQEAVSSQSGGPVAFECNEDTNKLQEIIVEIYGDYLQDIALHDSENFCKLRQRLPDASHFLVDVMQQMIDMAKRRNPRAVLIPNNRSPDPRNSHSNQSEAVTQQVRGDSTGRNGGFYKCWKCGKPKVGHSCNLPKDFSNPYKGFDKRMWDLRLGKDVIKMMNDAVREQGVVIPPPEKHSGKKMAKKRGSYGCDFCRMPKKSEFHKKYCIFRPGTKITLGPDGETLYHATPTKSHVRGGGKTEEEDDDDEDDRKPAAIDMDKKGDGDGGKGADKDDSGENANGDGDGDGGFAGVARYPV